ncbi:LOW QUALITY PROTEIN: complement C3-like [Aplochiton taeniatus]
MEDHEPDHNKDFTKTTLLLQDSVELNQQNDFHSLKAIELSSDRLARDEDRNKFVHLKVEFVGHHSEELLVMVSFHSGYIFIQTDKPLYNPGDNVRCRALVSSPAFKAFDNSISVEFQNSEGLVVKKISRTRPNGGVFADTLPLSELVSEGTWKIVAKFDHWQQNTFTTEFEVKKYVLPAFNVTLTPKKSFLSLDDIEIEVTISANYLYGEPVQGTAYVVFGVETNGEKKRLPSVKQVTKLNEDTVKLTMEEIKAAYPNIRELVGSSVYVKASVLTQSGGDLVEAEKSGIRIVESPYVISFRDLPRFFKPGMPFDLTIRVSHHDGSPARDVPVQLSFQDSPLTIHSGSLWTSINMPKEMRSQTITVETVKGGLKPEQQARRQVTVSPYEPFSRRQQNYLYISSGASTAAPSNSLLLGFHISTPDQPYKGSITHLTYLVLNKGKIVFAQRMGVVGQLVTNVQLAVTKEMMPSFRVLAFYTIPWAGRAEVVADSIWVDVTDTCVGGLSVGPADSGVRDYQPGKNLRFRIRGDPGAKVNLVAVDNAVYLLNSQRLTQKKIWDVVEKGDVGCTRGGGSNAMGVFHDAGLMFYTTTGVTTPTRSALGCPGGARRRRRSAELLRKRTQLESQYKERLPRRCCKDGLREIPMAYSCTRRSLYITEGWECMRAFRHCCSQYRGQEFDTRPPPTTTPPPPTTTEEEEEEEEYLDQSDVYLRSKFYESWLWRDVRLPSAADNPDGLSSYIEETILPDSITEWGLLAISSSAVTGFCVAEPYNVKVWKDFYVDLRLPHSVARNEHLEVKAVLQNHRDEDLDVKVVLMKTEGMCSVAFSERHTQDLKLAARSSLVVPFTVVPLVTGQLPLEVMVLGKYWSGGDRVQKLLNVVVEGVQKTKVQSFVLNPSDIIHHGGKQVIEVGKVELNSVVPNSEPETYINIRGHPLADSIDNSISEDSLGSLIRMPGGCVEQNLASIILPLIATHYLDRTNQWEVVGVQRRSQALKYIERGYQNQLAYRRTDGSYPPYRNEGASTWITAFVVKVFSMAHAAIVIDGQQVCDAVSYLIENKQKPSGAFREDNSVYSTTMTGGLQGSESETTLTAFVSIALSEAKAAGIDCHGTIDASVLATGEYLRRVLRGLKRPYTVAITSYALSLIEKTSVSKEFLLSVAAPERRHWPDSENRLFTLEATGYALLAMVKCGYIEEAALPFHWLNTQRQRGGAYGSTQPTLVVLQALSEYLVQRPPPDDLNLLVDVRLPGRSDLRYLFNPKTSYVARSSKVPLDQEFEVEATGNGLGILEVVTYYNELPNVKEKETCNDFELDVTIKESSVKPPVDAEKTYQLTINVKALGPREVRMVVLDISLPTGFTPENSDLELLTNSVDRYISNFAIVDNLSDRGSLIIHLFKVSNTRMETISFRLQQTFKVGLLQPSSVTVYEYYNRDHNCTRLYNPTERQEELTQICRDNVCRCTQGDCCVPKTDSQTFLPGTREALACYVVHHVFKVKVVGVSHSNYDNYDMEITQVIKLGKEEGVRAGQRRSFLSHAGCREGLNLQQGSEYLVIGPREDVWSKDSATNSHTYILGKNTWVERWPTSEECSGDNSLRSKCASLEAAAGELQLKGCLL